MQAFFFFEMKCAINNIHIKLNMEPTEFEHDLILSLNRREEEEENKKHQKTKGNE